MKVFSTLMALAALSGALAFVPQAPKAPQTKLESSYYGGRGGSVISDREMSSVGSSTVGGALANGYRGRGYGYDRSRYGGYRGGRYGGGGYGYGGGAYGYGRSRYGRGGYSYGNRYNRGYGYGNRRGWDTFEPTIVQGGSLETWSFPSVEIDRVQVRLATEGRPLNANVELWQGPDNSPQKIGVYLEDGDSYPFNAVIASPRGSNAIAIRNTGQLEFPLEASVEEDRGSGMWDLDTYPMNARTVQGGAVYTEPFPPGVESVQLMLRTDGRPLNARIELLQGPNNNKQVMEVYTEDGDERPFLCVLETPEVGNVIRIVNTATVEFPLTASLEPFSVDGSYQIGRDYDYGYSTENRLDGSTSSGARTYNVGYGSPYGGGYDNRYDRFGGGYYGGSYGGRYGGSRYNRGYYGGSRGYGRGSYGSYGGSRYNRGWY